MAWARPARRPQFQACARARHSLETPGKIMTDWALDRAACLSNGHCLMTTREELAAVQESGWGGKGYQDLLYAIILLEQARARNEIPAWVPASQPSAFARRIWRYIQTL
jgi:hypothetical protein